MLVHRSRFFSHIRHALFAGRLAVSQVAGLSAILDRWDRRHADEDRRWLAYILATVHHETDRTFQPIREYGQGKGLRYGRPAGPYGHVYYGRGFVQLTWEQNYARMSAIVGRDLLAEPDLALDMEIACAILFEGMIAGSFTGRRLSHYFNPTKEDWVGARRIINGTDKAGLIAGYARRFHQAIGDERARKPAPVLGKRARAA